MMVVVEVMAAAAESAQSAGSAEVVGGVLGALDHLSGYQVYNLGESDRIALNDLIELLGKALGVTPQIESLPLQPGDVSHTNAEINKARAAIGYDPQTPINEGIRRFAAWFQARPYLWRED